MSETTLQRFEQHAEQCLRNADNLLERSDDLNALELQIERLALLLTMYNRIRQFYDNVTFEARLNEINFIKRRIEQTIQFLNHDTSFAVRNFVTEEPTGRHPKIIVDEEAVKLLRQHGFTWKQIGT